MAHQFIEAPPGERAPADNRLFLAVRKKLWDYEPLRATRAPLTADVHEGRVRLGGRTRSEALRLIAAYLASFVPGVLEIENEIVSDDQVIRGVADALASDPVTAAHCIRVNARYGDVLLEGEVTSPQAELRAVEIAASVPMVVGARSDLSVVRAGVAPA